MNSIRYRICGEKRSAFADAFWACGEINEPIRHALRRHGRAFARLCRRIERLALTR
jgi:hypothetical protein